MAFGDDLIEWCDPPPASTGGTSEQHPWAAVAYLLRARPGKWACIEKGSAFWLAPRIKRGVGAWRPEGAFEAVTRMVDGRIYTWARYVG